MGKNYLHFLSPVFSFSHFLLSQLTDTAPFTSTSQILPQLLLARLIAFLLQSWTENMSGLGSIELIRKPIPGLHQDLNVLQMFTTTSVFTQSVNVPI